MISPGAGAPPSGLQHLRTPQEAARWLAQRSQGALRSDSRHVWRPTSRGAKRTRHTPCP